MGTSGGGETAGAGAQQRAVISWREGAAFIGLVLASRIALTFLLALAVKGREFADDLGMHLSMIHEPFQLLLGHTARNAQHPPLLPVLEALFVWPFLGRVPDFYAIRVPFILYEGLTALFLWLTLRRLDWGRTERLWAMAAFVAIPMGWVTTAVMRQDEVIGAAFVAAALWLVSSKRHWAALVLSGLGLAAAKIFLAIPLLALVVVLPVGRLWTRALAGFAPVALVYGWTALAASLRGEPAPLVGFVPGAGFGITFWVPLMDHLGVTPDQARSWSGPLALAGGLVPLGIFVLRREAFRPEAAAALVAAMMLWVFQLFYHVNPEYYILPLVPLLVVFRTPARILGLAVTCGLTWGVNFFYGVRGAAERGDSGGKRAFVELYERIFPVEPGVMFHVCLLATVVATAWLTVSVTRDLLRARGEGREREAGLMPLSVVGES